MIRAAGKAPQKYMTTAEVAEYFSVAASRVAKWIKKGEMVAVNASVSPVSKKPQYRIRPEAVERFEAARDAGLTYRPRRRRRASYPKIV